MKKRNLFVAGVVGLSLCAPLLVNAAEEGGQLDSYGIIKFKTSDETTPPVDPIDPEKPVEPEGEPKPEPGTPGPLSIDFVSTFDFEEQDITSADAYYTAKPQTFSGTTPDRPNYLQVTDNRGTQKGWNLTVKQPEPFKTDDGHELVGTTITLRNGLFSSTTDDAYKPVGSADGANEITILPTNNVTAVINASEEKGMGTWVYRFGDIPSNPNEYNGVELFVPGGAVKLADTYSTTLEWTLADTPSPDTSSPEL